MLSVPLYSGVLRSCAPRVTGIAVTASRASVQRRSMLLVLEAAWNSSRRAERSRSHQGDLHHRGCAATLQTRTGNSSRRCLCMKARPHGATGLLLSGAQSFRGGCPAPLLAVGAGAGDFQAVGIELAAVLVVQLKAMAVPFGDAQIVIRLVGMAPLDKPARVRAKPHSASLVGDGVLFVEHADHWVGAGAIEFCAVRLAQTDHVAGELDHRALQAQANSEEGDFLLASIADS